MHLTSRWNINYQIINYFTLASKSPALHKITLICISGLSDCRLAEMGTRRANAMFVKYALCHINLTSAAHSPPATYRIYIYSYLPRSLEQVNPDLYHPLSARGGKDDFAVFTLCHIFALFSSQSDDG
jgi:hypothetical protein